ncbi:MAG: response regulator [Rhodospirillales bacterium]|nr:response regulator [Rhodospirillales bacterium]
MNNPAQPNAGVHGKPKQNDAYSLSNFRILIVEDYPFMADLIATMLREFGVGNIVMANSGSEAKEMLVMLNTDPGSRNHIDMIVTDWLMPDGDGTDLLDWIRGHKKDTVKFIPVILCSAYTSEEVVEIGRDHGANEVLVKPVSAKKLASRLLHMIDHPRPFIKAPDFFGPDRRRKVEPFDGEDKRKMKPEEIKESHERI